MSQRNGFHDTAWIIFFHSMIFLWVAFGGSTIDEAFLVMFLATIGIGGFFWWLGDRKSPPMSQLPFVRFLPFIALFGIAVGTIILFLIED